jgi:benzoyl-CoA reductase/2-hydroxyglutaryl-CoA dehydratase subunit BcrC/BadD/HgdB
MTKQQRGAFLQAARDLAANRDKRVRELKSEGRQVIGYFCSYMPLEILTAASLVPYRIQGNPNEPITEADAYLDPGICRYLKSCYDMVLKGQYDFLDGWVTPDSCDSKVSVFKVWTYNRESPFVYWLNVPNVVNDRSLRFFKEELAFFRQRVEEFSGTKVSNDKLHAAIEIHNEQRALLRSLYQLRKMDPPLLFGSEVTQIMTAVGSLPPEEANHLLRGIVTEARERGDLLEAAKVRVLLYGPEIDNPAFLELIEDCGGNVVIDDMCVGTRVFWHDVDQTNDPLDGLANRYLTRNVCPRIIRGKGEGWSTRQADLEERFGYVWELAKEFEAKGVICYIMKYCDWHTYDLPDLTDFLQDKGLPVLHIENDYTMAAMMGLRTRVEAFLETIV